MKTKNNYPENTSRIKALLIAGLILIHVTLLAGKGSLILKDSNNTAFDYSENTKYPSSQMAGNACDYLLDEATENELKIEDWMCNTQNSFWFDLEDAKESEPAIEDWMCNTQDSFWLNLTDVKESEPAIENWMTNPNGWTDTGDELMLTSK